MRQKGGRRQEREKGGRRQEREKGGRRQEREKGGRRQEREKGGNWSLELLEREPMVLRQSHTCSTKGQSI